MGGFRAGRALPLVVLVLILAACGNPASGTPDAPALEVGAVRAVDLGAYDAAGVTETGIYTVGGDAITGWSPDGERRWTIRRPGHAPDAGEVEPVPYHDVLLTRWEGSPGAIAYSTETGAELWRTPEDSWFASTVRDGLVVFRDPETGADRWSADPARWGCVPPVNEEDPTVVPLRDIVLLRCPTGADRVVVGLDPADGAERWQRPLPAGSNAVVDAADTVLVKSGAERVFLAAATGAELGRQPVGDGGKYRLPRPGGAALVMDSTTLAENTEMRMVEPDGSVRWTAPLAADEEVLVATTATGTTVLATVRQRAAGHAEASLVAYDAATGARTHVAGPAATADGEPLLTMPVATTATLRSAPWGVLIAGADGRAAVIPSG